MNDKANENFIPYKINREERFRLLIAAIEQGRLSDCPNPKELLESSASVPECICWIRQNLVEDSGIPKSVADFMVVHEAFEMAIEQEEAETAKMSRDAVDVLTDAGLAEWLGLAFASQPQFLSISFRWNEVQARFVGILRREGEDELVDLFVDDFNEFMSRYSEGLEFVRDLWPLLGEEDWFNDFIKRIEIALDGVPESSLFVTTGRPDVCEEYIIVLVGVRPYQIGVDELETATVYPSYVANIQFIHEAFDEVESISLNAEYPLDCYLQVKGKVLGKKVELQFFPVAPRTRGPNGDLCVYQGITSVLEETPAGTTEVSSEEVA